jgi:thioredoxin reductase (NADPH)
MSATDPYPPQSSARFGDLSKRREQMFPVLTDAQMARIGRHATEATFEPGQLLFDEGQYDTPFFVVLDGEVEVVHPVYGGEEPVTVHHRGQFTGEINMLAGRRALARGRAKSLVRVLSMTRAELSKLVRTDSELSDLIMRAFTLRRMGLLAGNMGDAIVLGSQHSAATLRLQAFLTRNGHPYRYVDVDRDPDVQCALDTFHLSVSDVPVLICRGERVLKNPTNAEVADCLGFNASIESATVVDVVVCGAGPGGLAAAVYAASEGLEALVLEESAPGGQAGSSSKIENYLGFPTGISGQALALRAMTQAEKFGAKIAVARDAKRLWCDETPMRVELGNGDSVRARAIIIATGVEYRKLGVEGLARFEGVGVYYGATFVEAQRCENEEVIVVGGGNSAGQAATFLARSSTHVHVLIRGPDLAASMSRYLIARIEETANITLHRNTEIVAMDGSDHLERISWRNGASGETSARDIRHVFSMTGASPRTEWLQGCVALDAQGFVRTGPDLSPAILAEAHWPHRRAPYLFETSRPGVFAVGDVRAGSVKRVASAVGEGSVCVQLVHKVLAE